MIPFAPLRRAVATLLLLALPRPSVADPRWWWSDVRLTNTASDSITPHLRSPGYATGGAGGQAVFLTYAEVDPAEGDLDIWLTASFDAGCTFCPPTRLTDTDVDETRPRVAVLALPEGFWSIAVIFERPSTGEVIIAWDSTRLSYQQPHDAMCLALTALGPQIAAADQYFRHGGRDANCSWPDIAAAGTMDFGHFHATWAETTLLGSVIQYAHDLTARGGIGWRLDPIKTVGMPSPAVEPLLERPRITADLLTDPDPDSGNSTRDRSAPSIVYVRHRNAGPAMIAEIVGLRSVDSGVTFSPDGSRADAPAAPLSEPMSGGLDADVRPALDAAFSSFSTEEPAWISAAWSAERPGDMPLLACDERRLQAPASPLPDWRPGSDEVLGLPHPDGGAPSLAVQHQFGAQPAPQWIAWHDARSGIREIVSRAGILDEIATPPFDASLYPIAPARPLDTAVSADVQLSHCAVDEATLLCPTTRMVGMASDPSIDANEMGVFMAWSDTRDGNAEIYFKRVDTFVSANAPLLSTGCDPSGTAHVDVTFTLNPSCPTPFAGERMLRYLIYWRDDASGGYANAASPLIVMAADEPGPTATRRITGLSTGTSWRVIVVPEDEARNVFPLDFDPSAAPSFVPFNEQAIVTADPCVVVPPCLWRSDVTSLSPHVPARADVYLVPPSAEDIHLEGASYECPFASGDLEPDATALDNGVPLSLYQVNRPFGSLRLAKSARSILFTW